MNGRQLLAATAALLFSTVCQAAWLTTVDHGSVNGGFSFGSGVSADGSTVGGSVSRLFGDEPFRWTEAAGMQPLGDLPGARTLESHAYAVSADGSVVVGSAYGDFIDPHPTVAFRWSQAFGMQPLGYLTPFTSSSMFSVARGVSSDASVIVGASTSFPLVTEAFRWTQAGGMQGLGVTLGGGSSFARGVSSDGNTIVGDVGFPTTRGAFRWTPATNMHLIGDLPGGTLLSIANAVSLDGTTIVGFSSSDAGLEAFRWTEALGMQPLGDLPGGNYDSEAFAVSGDGSVIVGHSHGLNGYEAFVWTAAAGMQTMHEYLTAAGLSTTGWHFDSATGISADGNVIAGTGLGLNTATTAWVANLFPIPEPTAAVLFLSAIAALSKARRKL
jgi:probable HAF family extracellular repeat protein